VASSEAEDTATAIEQLLDDLDAADAVLTIVFYGIRHDDQTVARALDAATGERGVAGTTAGELNSQGFANHSMTGMSFHSSGVRAAIEIIPHLGQLSLVPIVNLPDKLAAGIGRTKEQLDPDRHLWLFMVDGLSGKEELLTPFFMQAAARVGLVGTSLGAGAEFGQARIAHHGRVYRDAAATILLEYDAPFATFEHCHMTWTDRSLEITKVSTGGRVLEQLDSKVAQVAYAEALGIDPSQVTPSCVALHPLGYRFRGRPCPVSILQIHPDGTFRLGSSVQHGEQLNLLEPDDLIESTRACLQEAIAAVNDDSSAVEAMLLFHCVGRFVEAAQSGLVDELSQVLCQTPVCGLNTYGEQIETMHMNHSLTGVVFG
jgi:hypothetical protein